MNLSLNNESYVIEEKHNVNGLPKEVKIKTQKLDFLNTKRSKDENLSERNISIQRSKPPRVNVSSKSLQKYNDNLSQGNTQNRNKTVNISSNSIKTSGVKAFNSSKSPSQISLNSILLKQKAKTNSFDFSLIAKIISGGVSIYALSYLCYNNIDAYTFHNIGNFISSNRNELLIGIAFTFGAILLLSVAVYIKNRNLYKELCKEIANKCQKDIKLYLTNTECNEQSFIEEVKLITILSESFNIKQSDFITDVYKPFLISLLESDSLMSRKEYIEDGEIKVFWMLSEEELISESN